MSLEPLARWPMFCAVENRDKPVYSVPKCLGETWSAKSVHAFCDSINYVLICWLEFILFTYRLNNFGQNWIDVYCELKSLRLCSRIRFYVILLFIRVSRPTDLYQLLINKHA